MQTILPYLTYAISTVSGPVEQFLSEPTEKQLDQAIQLAGVVVSGVIAIIVAILAYIVARQQTINAQVTKEIERQRLLHELERDFDNLTNTQAVWIKKRAKFSPESKYKFIIALTRDFQWNPLNDRIKHSFIDSDRFVNFTSDNALLNSSVLHEFLNWFRRVARAYKAGLIQRSDLVDLWRKTLPFATDYRYQFLSHYFGAFGQAPSGEDISSVKLVLTTTILHCVNQAYRTPCQYISTRLDPLLRTSFCPQTIEAIAKLAKIETSPNSAERQTGT